MYVSQRFGGNVRRVDLQSQSAGLQFGLGSDQSGTLGVSRMQVTPGNASALAIAHNHLSNSGMAPVRIYDEGISRAVDTGSLSFPGIVFSNPNTLYGYSGQFRTMSVTPSGVTIATSSILPLGGDLEFANGLVYSPGGNVAEAATRTLTGKFQFTVTNYSPTSVIADTTLNLVFFAASGMISVYNRFDYTLVGTLKVSAGNVFAEPSLQRWGSDGLAFRTDTQVFLLRIPSSWAVPNPPRRSSQITSQ